MACALAALAECMPDDRTRVVRNNYFFGFHCFFGLILWPDFGSRAPYVVLGIDALRSCMSLSSSASVALFGRVMLGRSPFGTWTRGSRAETRGRSMPVQTLSR